MKIRNETKRLENLGTIQGVVTSTTLQEGPVMVRQFVQNEEGVLILKSRQYASDKGEYQFNVEPGGYYIGAFVDVNRDGKIPPEAPEPFHFHHYRGEPVQIIVNIGETVTVNLTITDTPPPLPNEIKVETALIPFLENIGSIANLNDPRFDPKHYSTGLWRPFLFLEQAEGGLFFLQEYDPDKIPVLFVHGANGGPRAFEKMIESLDKQLFQPWVFYYPSGMRLNKLSEALVRTVHELKIKRGDFNQLYIVAHSMGGLATRSFVKNYIEKFPEDTKIIRLVMTINSPMGGMKSAAKGVKNSPVVVPCWRDVATGSTFLEGGVDKKGKKIVGINEWNWPKEIPYYLIVSNKTGKDGDGTVSMVSQANNNQENQYDELK